MKLGVNIDHIATLRNARGGVEPSVAEAAKIALKQKVYAVTMHLREDRRHIKEADLIEVKNLGADINLEMAAVEEIKNIALQIQPKSVCLVPEKRQEITTEGGLDVLGQKEYLKEYIKPLKEKGILISLFIDPDINQIDASKYVGADYIELHTGSYSEAFRKNDYENEFDKLSKATQHALSIGLKVNAGHGLNYENVHLMKKIKGLSELNIGHSIISKAVFVGLEEAISEMKDLIS